MRNVIFNFQAPAITLADILAGRNYSLFALAMQALTMRLKICPDVEGGGLGGHGRSDA